MSRIPPSLVVRAVLYGSILVYVAGDLYFWRGPLRHTLEMLHRDPAAAGAGLVVARGVGFQINLGDVDAEVATRWTRGGSPPEALPRSGDRLRDLRRAALDDLVAQACLDQKRGPRPPGPEATARILAEAETRFGGREALDSVLRQAGINRDQFVDTLDREAFRTKWWDDQFSARKVDEATEPEIQSWWNAHGPEMRWPRRVKARHLFKASLHQDPAALSLTMRSLHSRLAAAPALFSSLTAAESDDEASKRNGGELGWIEESTDRLPAGLEFNQLAASAPGTLLPPMQSRLGWHIFLVEATEPARSATLDEMRPQIVARIAEDHRRQTMARLRAELRFAAKVEEPTVPLDPPLTLTIAPP